MFPPIPSPNPAFTCLSLCRLCLVGSCPGGTASNVVTYLARADVTLSVLMTTASTLGAVVATPALTKLLLGTLVPVDALGLLVSTVQASMLANMLFCAGVEGAVMFRRRWCP